MSSLRFVCGPSGCGKSTRVYMELLDRAAEHPATNFLVIVPDQFTMQTQKSLAHLSGERHGIMNIDVLSFNRLTHRILQEVGTEDLPVLDDTGKCLILQKLAGTLDSELEVMGSRLHKQGYIHEVKSVLSEFLQYGIGEEELEKMIAATEKRGALCGKLKDLRTIRNAFSEYLDGKYITREGRLDRLREAMPDSHILPGSVLLFDGFTGFTPIQIRVMEDLLVLSEEMIVTLAMDEQEQSIHTILGEQDLFAMSKQTVISLSSVAAKHGIEVVEEPVMAAFDQKPDSLLHLEKNLFRLDSRPYKGKNLSITLREMTTIPAEVHHTALKIAQLVREEGLQYRDIAMVCGDLGVYAPYIEREFAHMELPIFLDQTKGIRLNPIVEAVRSSLNLLISDFSLDAVVHFMRSGLCCLSMEEADELEQYLRETGIRGQKNWGRMFSRKNEYLRRLSRTEKTGRTEEDRAAASEAGQQFLIKMNDYRNRLMEQLAPLFGKNRDLASSYVNRLYDFLLSSNAEERLWELSDAFAEKQDAARQREYAQVYGEVLVLLDQLHHLIGEEEITTEEFLEILDAGFGEIRLGTIPQNVDRILVGDMERSRLQSRKILFVLGVNDGLIPKAGAAGGLLSELDREFIREAAEKQRLGLELAPTPRQEVFSQRLYLYLNLTKPTEHLYVSYSALNVACKSQRPSYLVAVLRELFPALKTEIPENGDFLQRMGTYREGLRYLAEAMREAESGALAENPEDEKSEAGRALAAEKRQKRMELLTLYDAYERSDYAKLCHRIREAAFERFPEVSLSEDTAGKLYSHTDARGRELALTTSVSQLETFAKCPRAYFLRYGLLIPEPKEYEIGSADNGTVIHDVLKRFSEKLSADGYTWKNFPAEYLDRVLADLMEEVTAEYASAVFYDNARNRYQITRLHDALHRSIHVVQKQLGQGSFAPYAHEKSFYRTMPFGDRAGSIALTGSIDRVDTALVDGKVYVKVVDYKTGKHALKWEELLSGRALQLPLYLGQEMSSEELAKEGEVKPGAMQYFMVDNPVAEAAKQLEPEEIEKALLSEQRLVGVANQDIQGILGIEDQTEVPVMKIAQTKTDTLLTEAQLQTVMDYALRKAKEEAEAILRGDIALSPLGEDEESPCTYCAYRRVCGWEEGAKGCRRRIPEKISNAEALAQMEELLHGGTKEEKAEGKEE